MFIEFGYRLIRQNKRNVGKIIAIKTDSNINGMIHFYQLFL